MSQSRKISRLPKADVKHDLRFRVRLRQAWHSARTGRACGDTFGNAMPRSYASDLLVDDFDLDGSRIGGYPVRPRRRRSDVLMMLVAAGASAAVLFNALAMQDGRRETRPATAATPAIPVPTAAPAEVRKTVAAEPAPATPAAASPATSAPMSLAAAPPRPPVKPAAPPRVAAAPVTPTAPSPAPIGALSNDTTGTVRPPADVAVSPRVMEIQKALAKLGYGPIKVDGRGGDATKDAIERFERDRRLPVTGAISDRLVRELNAVAGFSIQ